VFIIFLEYDDMRLSSQQRDSYSFAMTILAIAVGGAFGSVLRYLVGGAVQRSTHAGFPYGTLAVNIIGCLVIGMLIQHFMNAEPASVVRGFLVVGFCGGFTTFSAFSMETIGLVYSGSFLRASAYVLASVVLSLSATAAGITLVRTMSR
jgi:CrcB protein